MARKFEQDVRQGKVRRDIRVGEIITQLEESLQRNHLELRSKSISVTMRFGEKWLAFEKKWVIM